MGGGRKVREKVLRWGWLHTCGCIRFTLVTERHFSRPANVIGTRQRPNWTVIGLREPWETGLGNGHSDAGRPGTIGCAGSMGVPAVVSVGRRAGLTQ